jgi:hypothetical protein
LDVDAETIAAAVAEPDGEVQSLGTIPNRTASIRKLIKKLSPADKLGACCEAGPTGYVVYWRLPELTRSLDIRPMHVSGFGLELPSGLVTRNADGDGDRFPRACRLIPVDMLT